MKTNETAWVQGVPLPADMTLRRVDGLVVREPGAGGKELYDLVDLGWGTGSVLLLVAFRDLLFPRDVAGLAERLEVALGYLRQRAQGSGTNVLPALVTGRATPAILDACRAHGLAVLDLSGTLMVVGAGAYVRISGQPPSKRTPRAEPPQPFAARGCRIVRLLLASPEEAHTARRLAKQAQAPHTFAQTILTRLEKDGFLARASSRGGFRVVDAAGLLRAWVESGERTAVAVEAFHAPAVDEKSLRKAAEACRAAGIPCAFTLASALLPGEPKVDGLPHGLYVAGDMAPAVEALGLHRSEPHDFLILRADLEAETEAGGVFVAPRELPYGRGVALPQLVVCFAQAGGECPAQAELLLEQYAAAHPPAAEKA